MYDNLIGKKFEYNGNAITITKFIASGGNSVVFECNYLNENYVIKYFRGNKIKRYKRFKSEIEKINRINSKIENCTPSVIEIYFPKYKYWFKKINYRKSPFYIMEKGNIFDYRNITFVDKIDRIIEISLKLQEMHNHDIIHRDIKPENIINYQEKLSLIDFGTSYVPGIETIDIEEIKGSIDTMAPEMFNKINGYDELTDKYADVYSLGKTMWIILTNDHMGRKFTTYDFNALNSKIKIDGVNDGIIMELEQIIYEATKENYLERISLSDLIRKLIIIKEKLINNYENCNINKFKCMLNQFSNSKYDSVNINDNIKILKFIPQINLVGVKISLIDTGIKICDSLKENSFLLSYDAKIKMYYFELNNTRFIFDIDNININDKSIIIKTNELKDITDDNYIRLKDIDSFSRMSILTNRIDSEIKKIYIECEIFLEKIELK